MRKREQPKFRVVCENEEGKITLRAKGADKYEAFEQVVMFLRGRGFDYQVVLVEPSGTNAPRARVRA